MHHFANLPPVFKFFAGYHPSELLVRCLEDHPTVSALVECAHTSLASGEVKWRVSENILAIGRRGER
jgi:hypothetical protein